MLRRSRGRRRTSFPLRWHTGKPVSDLTRPLGHLGPWVGIDDHEALHALTERVGGEHRHATTHRVAREHAPLDAQLIERAREIREVRVRAVLGAGRPLAPAVASCIDGETRPGQRARHLEPVAARPTDAMEVDNRRVRTRQSEALEAQPEAIPSDGARRNLVGGDHSLQQGGDAVEDAL